MTIRDGKALTNILSFEVFVRNIRKEKGGGAVFIYFYKIILVFFFSVPDVYIKYLDIYD